MAELPEKPDCYKCKWMKSISWNAHTKCIHRHARTSKARKLNIVGDSYGILRGWFDWPENFDRVWLLRCNGFEEK